jgi:hypothetical protein
MLPEKVEGYWKVQLICLAILAILVTAIYLGNETDNISPVSDTTPDCITLLQPSKADL